MVEKKHISEIKDLMQEWDCEANKDLDPTKINIGSKQKAWWVCKNCNNEWQATFLLGQFPEFARYSEDYCYTVLNLKTKYLKHLYNFFFPPTGWQHWIPYQLLLFALLLKVSMSQWQDYNH